MKWSRRMAVAQPLTLATHESRRPGMSIAQRKLKSGKTVYDVVVYTGFTVDGRRDRKKVTCRTLAAAKLEESKLVAMRDAMRGRSGRITLSQYIDGHYWPVAEKRLAATSLDTYEKEIRLRIRPALGNMDVRDIDRTKIQRMVDAIPTATVARKCVGVLKTILNHAKGDGLIMTNPAEATFAMPQGGRKRDNGLVLTTFDQIADLLLIVRERGSQSVQRLAYTGLLQGMRPEERYALDWADLDMEEKTIAINSAFVTSSSRHGGNQLKDTKTEKSTRVVPMHPDFYSWLVDIPSGGGAFIIGADGNRISPSTARKRWSAFLRDNPDAAPVTLENMRHSFATSYLHANGNIEDLSRMLGHSNINTTFSRYVRPSVDDLRRGLERITHD